MVCNHTLKKFLNGEISGGYIGHELSADHTILAIPARAAVRAREFCDCHYDYEELYSQKDDRMRSGR
jgi:hypothetical protein